VGEGVELVLMNEPSDLRRESEAETVVPSEGEATGNGGPSNGADGERAETFDFDAHRHQAVEAYQPLETLYADFARAVFSVMRTCLDREAIKVHSIDYRAKTPDSFGRKTLEVASDNPNQPKYPQPLKDITDLAGVRVITFFLSTEERVDPIIYAEFDVIGKTDKSALLEQEERLGYHSIHYKVRFKENRCSLPEYARFVGLVAEIQVRTILQHSWAEIEHDIQYKAVSTIPTEIRRRFMTLAGLLEIADREFQALEDEDNRLREEARASVAAGRLDEVEITPDALRSYLDKKFGSDGRMSEFSYEWESRVLRQLGFSDLRELDVAIAPYDDDYVSRAVHGSRQGQLTRLEDVLIAAMGDEEYLRRHPWSKGHNDEWFARWVRNRLAAMKAAGIEIGSYRPEADSSPEPTS
jgi:ppGpp synthetase/RelA/SpoT-type nucleotidyltranferase